MEEGSALAVQHVCDASGPAQELGRTWEDVSSPFHASRAEGEVQVVDGQTFAECPCE